jgi:hypothetical protein
MIADYGDDGKLPAVMDNFMLMIMTGERMSEQCWDKPDRSWIGCTMLQKFGGTD